MFFCIQKLHTYSQGSGVKMYSNRAFVIMFKAACIPSTFRLLFLDQLGMFVVYCKIVWHNETAKLKKQK